MNVWIVYADTYNDYCGGVAELFGIATTKEKLEEICNDVKKQGYVPHTDYLPVDEYFRKYLGGYIE